VYQAFKTFKYLCFLTLISTFFSNKNIYSHNQLCNSGYHEPLVKITETDNGLDLESFLYGKLSLDKQFSNENALIEIINNSYFKRLFNINQYGLSVYGSHKKTLFNNYAKIDAYSRGDHSINMAIILYKNNRPLKEIICALLHDATHTKFSHLGDTLIRNILCNKELKTDPIIAEMSKFITNEKDVTAIQDMIFEWFFDKTGFTETLKKYKIEVKDILTENNSAVKQKSPNICADNLEYTLTGCFLAGDLNKEEVNQIIKSLIIDDKGNWLFQENAQEIAKNFGVIAMMFDLKNAAAYWNPILNYYGAILLEKVIEKNIIAIEDLIFAPNLTDKDIWEKIKSYTNKNKDEELSYLIERIKSPKDYYDKSYDELANGLFCIKPKLRFINPYIENQDYLTKINEEFNYLYSFYSDKYSSEGWTGIKIKDDKYTLPNPIPGY